MEADPSKKLRIATIYSYGANEAEPDGILEDENSEDTTRLDQTSRDFLESTIEDYNKVFGTNYSTNSDKFQNYYKDVSLRMKNKEIDLLIVVGMFLTGFDATTLNTLWVDKNLKMHGLIQAFSRTNRILNSVKTFGNVVCFRPLKKQVDQAISLFGDKDAGGIVLLHKFSDYYNGFESKGKHLLSYLFFPSGWKIRWTERRIAQCLVDFSICEGHELSRLIQIMSTARSCPGIGMILIFAMIRFPDGRYGLIPVEMNAAVVVDKAFKRLVRFPIPEDLTSLVSGILLVHRKAKTFKRLVRFPIPEDLTSLVSGILLVHRKAKIKLCWITTSVYDLFGQKDPRSNSAGSPPAFTTSLVRKTIRFRKKRISLSSSFINIHSSQDIQNPICPVFHFADLSGLEPFQHRWVLNFG